MKLDWGKSLDSTVTYRNEVERTDTVAHRSPGPGKSRPESLSTDQVPGREVILSVRSRSLETVVVLR